MSASPITAQVDDVIAALSGRRYRYASEVALHTGLAEALDLAGIEHQREVKVVGGRIDFLIGAIGVEVKVKGSADALRRQLVRYAFDERIDQLLVVTTRPAHRQAAGPISGPLPASVPVTVLTVGGLGL